MPDIGGITGPNGPDPVRRQNELKRSDDKRSAGRSGVNDSVEISSEGSRKAEAAEFAAKLKDVPEVRQERIEEIQRQIQDGTYDVDTKIGDAISGLMSDLGMGHLQ